jgi:Domain of unknown function (DUF3560)
MFKATYSPQDNKLRFYSVEHLDSEMYAKFKDNGFKWAPKQGFFVAPMWTPKREDLLLNYVEQIEDEDSTTEERAEVRSQRFENYSNKREADANQVYETVQTMSEAIPSGQPILIGHHSEKKARKDAERIETGMRKVVKLWETSEYWKQRAQATMCHANYLEQPEVRARRLKGLQAEKRKFQRKVVELQNHVAFFTRDDLNHELALHYSNYKMPGWMIWSSLKDETKTLVQVKTQVLSYCERNIPHWERWVNHTDNRIAYETEMLQGWEPPKREKVKRELAPLLNFKASNGLVMTAAEWKQASKYDSYRVESYNLDGSEAGWRKKGDYRQRTFKKLFKDGQPVFITDMPVKTVESLKGLKDVG